MGTTRYVYNRCLDDIRSGADRNFYILRNKHVISLNNPIVNKWETETPKDIRAGGIQDLIGAFKTCSSNFRKGNVSSYRIRHRSKKKEASIVIPKTAVKIQNRKIVIYPRYISTGIRASKDKSLEQPESTCRLKMENSRFYLIIPKNVRKKRAFSHMECGIDPGIRKFQTIYGNDKVLKIEPKKEYLEKLKFQLDLFRSLRSKNKKNRRFKRRMTRTQENISNLVDDVHFKAIAYITKNYDKIYLPRFESQELMGNLSKSSNRTLNTWKHFKFRQRLSSKIEEYPLKQLIICTEEYTSKTCGNCGELNYLLGSKEIFACPKCDLIIDRDINGARNILNKNIVL